MGRPLTPPGRPWQQKSPAPSRVLLFKPRRVALPVLGLGLGLLLAAWSAGCGGAARGITARQRGDLRAQLAAAQAATASRRPAAATAALTSLQGQLRRLHASGAIGDQDFATLARELAQAQARVVTEIATAPAPATPAAPTPTSPTPAPPAPAGHGHGKKQGGPDANGPGGAKGKGKGKGAGGGDGGD